MTAQMDSEGTYTLKFHFPVITLLHLKHTHPLAARLW